MSCQIHQPERGKTAATPCLQVQPAARLKMHSRQARTHRTHVYTVYTMCLHIYVAGHTDHRRTLRALNQGRQHLQPHPAPHSVWAGWRSASKNIYLYTQIYIYIHTHLCNVDPPSTWAQAPSSKSKDPSLRGNKGHQGEGNTLCWMGCDDEC